MPRAHEHSEQMEASQNADSTEKWHTCFIKQAHNIL